MSSQERRRKLLTAIHRGNLSDITEHVSSMVNNSKQGRKNAVMLLSNLYLKGNKNKPETKLAITKIIISASPDAFNEQDDVGGMPLESAVSNCAFLSLQVLYDAGFTYPLTNRNKETIGRLLAQGQHDNVPLFVKLFPECLCDEISIKAFTTYWKFDNNLPISYIKQLLTIPSDTILLSRIMSLYISEHGNFLLGNMEKQGDTTEKLALLLKAGWLSEADINYWTQDKEFRPRIMKLVADSIEFLLDTHTVSAEAATRKVIRL